MCSWIWGFCWIGTSITKGPTTSIFRIGKWSEENCTLNMEAGVCSRALVPICQNTHQPTLEDLIKTCYKHYNNVHSIEIGIWKCGNIKSFTSFCEWFLVLLNPVWGFVVESGKSYCRQLISEVQILCCDHVFIFCKEQCCWRCTDIHKCRTLSWML